MKIMPVVSAVPTEALAGTPRQSQLAAAQTRRRRSPTAPIAARLGRREHAAVDAAEHDDEDRRDRPDARAARRSRSARIARALRRAVRPGMQAHVDRDRDQVADGRDDAGHERRDEQLGDVLLGQDRVDDEHDRRRDQDAERAAGGERRGREAPGVVDGAASPAARPAPSSRRSRPRCRRSRRRPRRRRTAAIARPPRKWPISAFAAPNSARDSPPCVANCAHQQEQRDDRQVVDREARARERPSGS